MPRKKRIWYPGARFHITSRGIRRTSLFHDAEDREKYLRLLAETKVLKPFVLQTYCLMTNHIHLQLETLHHPTSEIIKYLHTNYAKYFNRKYHFNGHVFESRYGSELIDSIEYELEVNRYIHLNPIRANMVKDLKDYKWSSYSDYIYSCKSSFVSTERIFTFFPEPKVDNYLKFLHAKEIDAKKYPFEIPAKPNS